MAPQAATVEKVIHILRTDLKLGDEYQIDANSNLFEGEIELDSLDVLLLVTSIEKQFGVKTPNEAVGKEVFQSVATLATFIDEQMGSGPAEETVTEAAVNLGDVINQLPHGEEFRFVSQVDELVPGQSAVARWTVKGDEYFFKGHFPNNPIVPGVLISEALAQTSGLAVAGNSDKPQGGVLVHVDVRFKNQVVPPQDIILHANHVRAMDTLHSFEVKATVNDEVVAEGVLTIALTDK